MFHTRIDGSSDTALELTFRYAVERLPVSPRLDPGGVGTLPDPRAFRRHLAPERHVDVDDETRALALEVVGGETNLLLRARRLFEHVTTAMAYDAEQQSWKGSTRHALVCSIGNCNDIHALFISLCRSVGMPARLILGQALEAPSAAEEECELCGYHCWAEFFAPGLGWIPIDASCACKYGTEGLFGSLETNHVAWSTGRDILLAPAQRGERVLFFAGPYAELEGKKYDPVERHITFSEDAGEGGGRR